jgi:hypothetical protein
LGLGGISFRKSQRSWFLTQLHLGIADVNALKKNYNHFLGSIISNPFEDLADPPFNVEQRVFVPNDPPGAYTIENMAHYHGTVLSVHYCTDEWNSVEGSAVMVAPGIAFTAAHVISPNKPHIVGRKVRVFCTGYTPSGPRYWQIEEVTPLGYLDVVILTLKFATEYPSNGCFAQTRVTTRLPGIGEQVMIVGFRASNEHVEADADMAFPNVGGHMRHEAGLRCTVGEVTQHFLEGRGAMAPGPAIAVSCSTPGGLSGGPAFDQYGKVFGILSSSLDHPDGRGPSLVSMTWPALAVTIKPAFLQHVMPASFGLPASFRLLDLDDRLCGIDRRDVIRSIEDVAAGGTHFVWDHYT